MRSGQPSAGRAATPGRRTVLLRRLRACLGLLAALAILAACVSSGTVAEVPSVVPDRIGNFLLPTLDGYSGVVNPEWRAEIDSAYTALVDRGETKVAAATAKVLLDRDASWAPARVLTGQVGLVEGRYADVVEELRPTLAELPDYRAGQLVLARSADLDDQVAVAYDAYRHVAGSSDAARRRAAGLEKRAVQAVHESLEQSLILNRLDQSEKDLQLLEAWKPDEQATWEARRKVLAAQENAVEELEILRQMATRWPADRLSLERQGMLELDVGEPREGLNIYQDLSERYPHDLDIAQGLAVAKFRWRLLLLPQDVQDDLMAGTELTRGDFATLLFWLVPNVRSASAASARIATDVLDHPQREAIVRVVNLRLMNVDDATLHRFSPDRPITRVEGLQSLLQVLEKSGGNDTCVDTLRLTPSPSTSFVCRTSVRCGLLIEEAECLPGAPLEGPEARELIRRTLAALGEEPR